MKLTQIPNLRVEDFSTEQKWIGRLFIQVNPFIQNISQVVNSNINFADNMKSVTKDYDITVETFIPFSFQWSFTDVPPAEVKVIKALKGTALTATILALAWSFDASQSTITVSQMVELLSTGVSSLSGRYQFTVRATI